MGEKAVPLVAKRKVRQTWRDIVAERGDEAVLARFEAICRETEDAGEAAYRALEAAGLLWRVDEPGRMAAVAATPEDSSGS